MSTSLLYHGWGLRGYHYVRSDNGDILLVAVTTGVIASIIASH